MPNFKRCHVGIAIVTFTFLSSIHAAPINLPAIDIEGRIDRSSGPIRNPIGDRDVNAAAAKADAAAKAAADKAAAAKALADKAASDAAAAKAAADKAAADVAAQKLSEEKAAAERKKADDLAKEAALLREKALAAEKEKFKIYVKAIASEVLSNWAKTVGGPVIWALWETGSRLLDSPDVGHHPMESGAVQVDPAALKILREQLDKEADETRLKYEKSNGGKVTPAAASALTAEEQAIVAISRQISSDAASVAETIIRYSKISPKFGERSIREFQDQSRLPVANACWSGQSKIARTIPYTQLGQPCSAFFKDGKPTKKPGVTVLREFANVCSVKWGTCPIKVKEVVDAPCSCVGAGRPGYGLTSLDNR